VGVALWGVLTALPITSASSAPVPPAAVKQLVVSVVADSDLPGVNATFGGSTLDALPGLPGTYLVATSDPRDLTELTLAISADPRVMFVEANGAVSPPEVESSRIWPWSESTPIAGGTQYARALLRLDAAHAMTTGAGAIVAVIDSGVQLQPPNPTLAASLLPGIDLIDGDGVPDDERNGVDDDGDGVVDEGAGHGTHVAGIVHLVAPSAKILPIRVLDSDGSGSEWDVAKAMMLAADAHADVVNLSLGRHSSATLLKTATSALVDRGVVVVAAAGNDGRARTEYPAASRCAIAVAASGPNDAVASFSSLGDFVDVAAPGVDIVSTHPFVGAGFASTSGTSMASPFVAGEAALLRSINPGLAPWAVLAYVRGFTSPLVGALPKLTGTGRIDIVGSLTALIAAESIDPLAVGVPHKCLPDVAGAAS
jgi:subtilisin family serine protease